jgi:hypothetical protein
VDVAHPIAALLQSRSLRAEVRDALDDGVGIYHTTWLIQGSLTEPAGRLAGELVDWCRAMLARMRRPYGLDHVTLSVALIGQDDTQLANQAYPVFRPGDFYDDQAAEALVRATLEHWSRERLFEAGGAGRISAVLFSWGDLARELLPSDS